MTVLSNGSGTVGTVARWEEVGACRTAEPDLFFPISARGPSAADTARAKKICASCPVQPQCSGGETEQERAQRRHPGLQAEVANT